MPISLYSHLTERDLDKVKNEIISSVEKDLSINLDARIIEAFHSIPRYEFLKSVEELTFSKVYAINEVLGQPISHTTEELYRLHHLDIKETDRILEIGGNTGYFAAILGYLGHVVFSIEKEEKNANNEKENLNRIQAFNVVVINKDGSGGLAEHSPFDKIAYSACIPSIESIPQTIFDQLSENGRILAPVRSKDGYQHYNLIDKNKESVELKLTSWVKLFGEYAFCPQTKEN